MKTLTDLFLDSLAEIYSAESQLVRALPKVLRAATDAELRDAFESLLKETECYTKKVESVFAEFRRNARAAKCEAIVDLLSGDEHGENGNWQKAETLESNPSRRHPPGQEATSRDRCEGYSISPVCGKPIQGEAAWKFLSDSMHCTTQNRQNHSCGNQLRKGLVFPSIRYP